MYQSLIFTSHSYRTERWWLITGLVNALIPSYHSHRGRSSSSFYDIKSQDFKKMETH